MLSSRKCPMCRQQCLTYTGGDYFISYFCEACIEHDVSGFEEQWSNNVDGYSSSLYCRNFRMEGFWIQLNYRNDHTTISKLEACLLTDQVIIERVLHFDYANPRETLEKAKMFVVFS